MGDYQIPLNVNIFQTSRHEAEVALMWALNVKEKGLGGKGGGKWRGDDCRVKGREGRGGPCSLNA